MKASLSRLQAFYGAFDAASLLHALITQEFPGSIALLTSFGADAALLLAMVAEVDSATPVLFLDTGKHFPDTLEYGRALVARLKLTRVHWLKPDARIAERIDPESDLWSTQPNRCCWLRKVEPLERAVNEMGVEALITGRKRYQTPERAELQTIEQDENGIFRINPLALWNKSEQQRETATRALPEHPLVAKGYLSIGCAPCTLPVEQGESERAGRWAHTVGFDETQKTECGIHVPLGASMDWSV